MVEAPTTDNISFLILAGGAGERMGGQDKPLLVWQAQPMVDHVAASVPSHWPRLISANRNLESYACRGQVVEDQAHGPRTQAGPLLGIAAGLQKATTPWLLVSPGDTPGLSRHWWAKLISAWQGQAAVVAHDGQRQQHLHLLVHKSCASELDTYLHQGQLAVHRWLTRIQPNVAYFDDAEQFKNINAPGDLE